MIVARRITYLQFAQISHLAGLWLNNSVAIFVSVYRLLASTRRIAENQSGSRIAFGATFRTSPIDYGGVFSALSDSSVIRIIIHTWYIWYVMHQGVTICRQNIYLSHTQMDLTVWGQCITTALIIYASCAANGEKKCTCNLWVMKCGNHVSINKKIYVTWNDTFCNTKKILYWYQVQARTIDNL